jgi:hypothetical protein
MSRLEAVTHKEFIGANSFEREMTNFTPESSDGSRVAGMIRFSHLRGIPFVLSDGWNAEIEG